MKKTENRSHYGLYRQIIRLALVIILLVQSISVRTTVPTDEKFITPMEKLVLIPPHVPIPDVYLANLEGGEKAADSELQIELVGDSGIKASYGGLLVWAVITGAPSTLDTIKLNLGILIDGNVHNISLAFAKKLPFRLIQILLRWWFMRERKETGVLYVLNKDGKVILKVEDYSPGNDIELPEIPPDHYLVFVPGR